MSAPNVEQAEYWEHRAPSWMQAEDHIERVGGRFGRLAMDGLGLEPGQRVLDVGCGSGGTTLELAGRVAPGGEAVGADISRGLVSAAELRATSTGAENARFTVTDAQVDDLGEKVFDAAFSRFGVMFFNDPVAAFTNIGRALRPGGILTFVCWQEIVANEWMFVPGAAVAGVTGVLPPMPAPGEPGPFSFSEPGRVEEVLSGAGFDEIVVTPLTDTVVIPVADLPSVVHSTSLVGAVREALEGADDDTRQRILDAVEVALRGKVADGELRLTASVFSVRARRP